MTLSLRARLTLWYTIALVVVLTMFGVNVLVEQQRLGIRRADRELDSVHATLATFLGEELSELDSPTLAAVHARDAIASLVGAMAILDARGNPLATRLGQLTLADIASGEDLPDARTIRTPSGEWRIHAEPATYGSTMFMLVVGRPLTDIAREQHEVQEAMLVGFPIALLLAGA